MLGRDDHGIEYVPAWSHARFAQACAVEEWAGTQARGIPLAEWLGEWSQGLSDTNTWVGVFPSPSNGGLVVHPQRLHGELEEELSLL